MSQVGESSGAQHSRYSGLKFQDLRTLGAARKRKTGSKPTKEQLLEMLLQADLQTPDKSDGQDNLGMGGDAPEEESRVSNTNDPDSGQVQQESEDFSPENSSPPGNSTNGTEESPRGRSPFIPPGRVQRVLGSSRSSSVNSSSSATSIRTSIFSKREDSLEREYHLLKLGRAKLKKAQLVLDKETPEVQRARKSLGL